MFVYTEYINQPSLISWSLIKDGSSQMRRIISRNHPKDGCYRSESPANHAQEIHRLTTMAQGTFAVNTRFSTPLVDVQPKKIWLGICWDHETHQVVQERKVSVFDDMSYTIMHHMYTGHLSSHTVSFNPNHRGLHFSKALKTMQQLTFSCSLLSNNI